MLSSFVVATTRFLSVRLPGAGTMRPSSFFISFALSPGMARTTSRAPREASSGRATTTLPTRIILTVPVYLFVHRQHAERNTPDMLLTGQRDHAARLVLLIGQPVWTSV